MAEEKAKNILGTRLEPCCTNPMTGFKKQIVIVVVIAVIGLVFVGCIFGSSAVSNIEISNYRVMQAEKNIEIREYAPMIIAIELHNNS